MAIAGETVASAAIRAFPGGLTGRISAQLHGVPAGPRCGTERVVA